MAFSPDIVIADAATDNVTYSQISLENSKSIRTDAARELGTPRSLTISHQTTGKNLSAKDRHLVRFDLVEADTDISDGIATVSSSVYLVIENPRRIITKEQTLDMVTQLVNFTTAANLAKIMNGEP